MFSIQPLLRPIGLLFTHERQPPSHNTFTIPLLIRNCLQPIFHMNSLFKPNGLSDLQHLLTVGNRTPLPSWSQPPRLDPSIRIPPNSAANPLLSASGVPRETSG